MLGETYQKVLIVLGLAVAVLFGIFTYKELFPEYKVYQNRYLELEKFKSSLEKTPMPFFKKGIKQLVLAPEDKGVERIDRCQSCHVALDLPHFSPEKVAYDINGKVRLDEHGRPLLVENENYIWGKLDQEIQILRDEKANKSLVAEGKEEEVSERLEKANELHSLKFIEINGRNADATKVLSMHPLLGAEIAPFELHPLEEYACSVCHSGNGRALTFNRAHGPLFDGDYKTEVHGEKPAFLEIDDKNDPSFSKMINDKPASDLLFQTEPILVGSLIESSCYNCHETQKNKLQKVAAEIEGIKNQASENYEKISTGVFQDKTSLKQLLLLLFSLEKSGYEKTRSQLKGDFENLSLPSESIEEAKAQLDFLEDHGHLFELEDVERKKTQKLAYKVKEEVESLIGPEGFKFLYVELRKESLDNLPFKIQEFLNDKLEKLGYRGSLIKKHNSLQQKQEGVKQLDLLSKTVNEKIEKESFIKNLNSSLEDSMKEVLSGEQLFLSQACYSCHMIERLSKGSVGPELTKAGMSYPWYIKESIVWPQADLKTSTMPNFRLDHEEVKGLVTFLLSQKGAESNQKDSSYHYKVSKKQWEAGAPLPWEKALSPEKIVDLQSSQVIFATEGCASCHILKGFDSKVGFNNNKNPTQKEKAFLEKLYENKSWFNKTFPKNVLGSQIAELIRKEFVEIDKRIDLNAKDSGVIENIEKDFPGINDSFYSNFKFASRSRNHEFEERLKATHSDLEKEHIEQERDRWNERLYKVKMMYIQEYGYGREIGPNLHFSGIYRDQAWLMGHFKNPQSHIAKSIMPVMPFDDSKFYALNHMLQVLAKENQKELQEYWEFIGFSPKEAFALHCASCHGDEKKGDGIVGEMLYPIPKNLTSAAFLRNLTKERAVDSIIHGVAGTPMAPWGTSSLDGAKGVLSEDQAKSIVDWLYLNLPGEDFISGKQNILKWNYFPKDILKELQKEGAIEHNEALQFLSSHKTSSGENLLVEDVFEVLKTSDDSVEAFSYLIKDSFYTPENLEEGQKLFVLNCAQCHGKEGEGDGNRAEAMVEAKPRALTNVPWLNSRDDLRLLRSIKFGVPGTAMLQWGDRTNSLQRIQLVLYLRHVNKEKGLRKTLKEVLFNSIDKSTMAVQGAQIEFYKELAKQELAYKEALRLKDDLLIAFTDKKRGDQNSLVKAFEEEVKALKLLGTLKSKNTFFENLIEKLAAEKNLFKRIAGLFISSDELLSLGDEALSFLANQENLFSYKDNKFVMISRVSPDKAYFSQKEAIFSKLTDKLESLNKEREVLRGQIPRHEKTEALESINQKISLIEDIKREFSLKTELISRERELQAELFKKNANDLVRGKNNGV
ncbi:hypothetical protein AB751O23_AN_00050 [Chlamydiales bacterium SCGC AB-751-O23]|jgi:mono/diheme cytochrome c family protein|nr:hypothetical protein AB751O23_AN_00050 [Chlamydiales bacterium SCGC AB-751-O23]